MNEITIPTNRTNRSIRQSCTWSPLSLMRCTCPIDDRTFRIDSKLFHLTNRTNRSNRQHFVHISGANEMQFSDRQQIECSFVGWNLFDSIGHECFSYRLYQHDQVHCIISLLWSLMVYPCRFSGSIIREF